MKPLFISDTHYDFKREIKVKSSFRKGKLVKAYTRTGKDKKSNLLRNSAIVAAAGLGLSVGSYALLRGRYRAGIKESATVANELAKKIKPSNLSTAELNRPNINYAVGGLWYDPGTRNSTQLASFVNKRIKGHTVQVSTRGMNDLPDKAPLNPLKIAFDMKATPLKNGLIKGHNPSARELAAQVKANVDRYPDKDHVLFGHSSGGYITNEAMHILKEMGVNTKKIKQVTYGANNYGILDSAENSLHIVDKNDWQANPFKFPNATVIGSPKQKAGKTLGEKLIEDHGAYHYTSSDQANNLVKDFVIPKDYVAPKKVTVHKTPSKKRITVNSDNSIAEEVRLLRESRKKLSAAKQSYNKALNNTNIPEDKKTQALSGAKKKLDNAQTAYQASKSKFKKKVGVIRQNKSNS
jgi:hypothetical protein